MARRCRHKICPATELSQLFEQRLQFGLLCGGEAGQPLAERLGEQGESAGHDLSTFRRQRELVAAEVGTIDLALYEFGRLEPLGGKW